MIPRTEFRVNPTPPENATFWTPQQEEISEEGIGFFRGTWNIGEVEKSEAIDLISAERRIADLVDQASSSHAEFETIAKAIEDSDPEQLPSNLPDSQATMEILKIIGNGYEEEPVIGCLEIGVSGLCHALASIGCTPAASCRGHLSDRPWSYHPVVFMAAGRSTVRWLHPLVKMSGCGFAVDEERNNLIVIESPSIENFMAMAELVVSTEQDREIYSQETMAIDCNQQTLW